MLTPARCGESDRSHRRPKRIGCYRLVSERGATATGWHLATPDGHATGAPQGAPVASLKIVARLYSAAASAP